MGAFYEHILKPLAFRVWKDPEDAHDFIIWKLRVLAMSPVARSFVGSFNAANCKPVQVLGLTFPNRVGFAAGFDKNAEIWPGARALGFGHVEVGTVTPRPQAGNERPRIFRYPKSEAIINRMGFPNEGMEAIANRIERDMQKKPRDLVLGINIGKNKDTPLDRAHEDYVTCFERLARYADYLTINISSPNTPDLRDLQSKEHLTNLLDAVTTANHARAGKGERRVPILVKIAPDLSFRGIDTVLEAVLARKIDGLVATNTTISRPGPFADVKETGGLSGQPLNDLAVQVVDYISRATGRKLPIIGVGGITDTRSAHRLMNAGASLVQVYTGFIYRGPFFGGDLANSLAARDRF